MDNVKTGKLIAECRREKGLTQQQLADILNLSNKTVSKWESGAGSPDISNLSEVAKALEISVDELLSGERNPNKTVNALPVKQPLTNAQIIIRALTLLGAAVGSVLGILAYNHGWLG